MFAALKNIMSKDEMDALSKSLIITTKNGYELFGEYTISPKKHMYEVKRYTSYLDKKFYNLRNAVVWTTLDKRERIKDAQRVAELDILIEGAIASIALYRELCENAKDLDSRTIYYAKLQEAKLKQLTLQEEIASYIRDSKRWQNQKFKLAAK